MRHTNWYRTVGLTKRWKKRRVSASRALGELGGCFLETYRLLPALNADIVDYRLKCQLLASGSRLVNSTNPNPVKVLWRFFLLSVLKQSSKEVFPKDLSFSKLAVISENSACTSGSSYGALYSLLRDFQASSSFPFKSKYRGDSGSMANPIQRIAAHTNWFPIQK